MKTSKILDIFLICPFCDYSKLAFSCTAKEVTEKLKKSFKENKQATDAWHSVKVHMGLKHRETQGSGLWPNLDVRSQAVQNV